MKLTITTPLAIIVEADGIAHLRAEDASGSFGILAGHADFLTALSVAVASWRSDDGNNYPGWASADYDALLFAAARASDPARRHALFEKAETLLIDAAPFVPLYHYTHVFLIQPSVKGWYPTVLDHHPYKAVWLEK